MTDPKKEKGVGKKPSKSAMKSNNLPGKRKDYRYTGTQRIEYTVGSGSKEAKTAERRGFTGEKGERAVMIGPNYERVSKPTKHKPRQITYGGSAPDKKSGTGTRGVTKRQVGRPKK